MPEVYRDMAVHLLAAVLAGGAIGLERSFHGRPAGFRTHTLVCLASSLLMLVTVYEATWFQPRPGGLVSIDPTRMVQGIMTGIGFLGAGVIVKEGLSVRGLTTAASIWITASIGVLIGVGIFAAAAAATLLVLGILSVFRGIETAMPTQQFANHMLRFARDEVMDETAVRALMQEHKLHISTLSYRLVDDGAAFEYRMLLRAYTTAQLRQLAETLRTMPAVREFRIAPTGE